jgi:hypothetical protein
VAATVQAPAFRVPKEIDSDIRTFALLSGMTESELLRGVVVRAIKRRRARRLRQGQTVER